MKETITYGVDFSKSYQSMRFGWQSLIELLWAVSVPLTCLLCHHLSLVGTRRSAWDYLLPCSSAHTFMIEESVTACASCSWFVLTSVLHFFLLVFNRVPKVQVFFFYIYKKGKWLVWCAGWFSMKKALKDIQVKHEIYQKLWWWSCLQFIKVNFITNYSRAWVRFVLLKILYSSKRICSIDEEKLRLVSPVIFPQRKHLAAQEPEKTKLFFKFYICRLCLFPAQHSTLYALT